jgi:hypothetical protein
VTLPEPGRFPDAWLAGAELSRTLGDPDRVGLSFFSTDAAAFDAFTTQIGLPTVVRDDEATLRGRFDLLPRRWVKLRYRAGERIGCSQYFAIHERNVYPVTTLRLFARRFGVRDVARLEPALAPALERDDTQWIASVRRTGATAAPRFSCRVPRTALRALVTTLAAQRFVDSARAARYLDWNDRLRAGDAAWVTTDPLAADLCGLDFEEPDPGSLPGGWRETAGSAAPPRYLKCRLRSETSKPEWVLYLAAAGDR